MIIIGIDPGVSGAISILENKKVIEIFDMPTMIDGKKNKKQVNGSQVSNIIKERLNGDKEVVDALIENYDTHYQEKKSYETLQDSLRKFQVKRLRRT